jgi:carboxyl-terminal processing protease
MRVFFATAMLLLISANLLAQSILDKSANDAFVITRMADKFHLQPKPINDEFSVSTYSRILQSLDGEKIFFTQEDIKQLLPYQLQLDDEVLGRKTNFLQLLSTIYEKRLRQVDTMIDNFSKSAFEFNSKEKLSVTEDTSYAANSSVQRNKIRKLLKANVLEILIEMVKQSPAMTATRQKQFTDSLEVIYRKKVQSTLKRMIKRDLESPGGIPQLVGETLCETIATYYDPHTTYFSLTGKENFDSELGQKSMMFGFGLDENDAEQVIISQLKPGSPAYKSGQLNEGDRIILLQWQGKQAIDVSDASVREIANILDASNHEKIKITVVKADGSKREVELAKAQMEDDTDTDKVKSFILKGEKKIGYISLPAFYSDWENEENVNGCANDVAKEIIKLKNEKIDGLILDLRYNGGGSVQEAVDLSGIFIDVGPVGMQKDRSSKVYTFKDMNRGTMYDGPLFIMVNGYSASASELVAGALQDHNRAVVIGSTTFGKATSQAVLPMDTTISLDKDISKRKTDSYLKLTLSKLYRATGATAQFSGVQPDVVLPDIIDANPQREQDELFALPATGIEGSKLFKPLPPLNKSQLQQVATGFVDTSAFFTSLSKYISQKKASMQKTDIPLSWSEAMQAKQKAFDEDDVPSFAINKAQVFSVLNNQYEMQRISANKSLKEMSDAWTAFLERDPYLQITFLLISKFTK